MLDTCSIDVFSSAPPSDRSDTLWLRIEPLLHFAVDFLWAFLQMFIGCSINVRQMLDPTIGCSINAQIWFKLKFACHRGRYCTKPLAPLTLQTKIVKPTINQHFHFSAPAGCHLHDISPSPTYQALQAHLLGKGLPPPLTTPKRSVSFGR